MRVRIAARSQPAAADLVGKSQAPRAPAPCSMAARRNTLRVSSLTTGARRAVRSAEVGPGRLMLWVQSRHRSQFYPRCASRCSPLRSIARLRSSAPRWRWALCGSRAVPGLAAAVAEFAGRPISKRLDREIPAGRNRLGQSGEERGTDRRTPAADGIISRPCLVTPSGLRIRRVVPLGDVAAPSLTPRPSIRTALIQEWREEPLSARCREPRIDACDERSPKRRRGARAAISPMLTAENNVVQGQAGKRRHIRHDAAVDAASVQRSDSDVLPFGTIEHHADAPAGGPAAPALSTGPSPPDFLAPGLVSHGAADAQDERTRAREIHMRTSVGQLVPGSVVAGSHAGGDAEECDHVEALVDSRDCGG